jgi:hypothetical protein
VTESGWARLRRERDEARDERDKLQWRLKELVSEEPLRVEVPLQFWASVTPKRAFEITSRLRALGMRFSIGPVKKEET